jgi:hypothetical protein
MPKIYLVPIAAVSAITGMGTAAFFSLKAVSAAPLPALVAPVPVAGDVCLREDNYRFPECVPRGEDDRGSGRVLASARDQFPGSRCAPGENGGVKCT